MTHRRLLFWGALHAALAVAAGAFAAHALAARVSARDLEIFEVGARYHMYGALALVLVALAAERGLASPWPGRWLHAGVWIFSGSLYVLVLSGQRWLGAITPLGGTAFLLGWLWWAVEALRKRAP